MIIIERTKSVKARLHLSNILPNCFIQQNRLLHILVPEMHTIEVQVYTDLQPDRLFLL